MINKVIFALDNGLVVNRWQAIIWTDGVLAYWRMYAPLFIFFKGDSMNMVEGEYLRNVAICYMILSNGVILPARKCKIR